MSTSLAHDIVVTEAIPGVHRIDADHVTIGYVVEAGPVFVALRGAVYNTSCEIGQALDLDTAVRLLLHD